MMLEMLKKGEYFKKFGMEICFRNPSREYYHFGLAVLHLKLSDLLLTADLRETIIALR